MKDSKTAGVFTREEILAAEDAATRGEMDSVVIPEWGGKKVFVRSMTSDERDKYEEEQSKGHAHVRANLVIATACDAEGKPLFSPEDAVVLGKKSTKPVQRIFNLAVKLNAITKDDIEELSKN
jgi:hypothetical protein